MLFLNYTLLKMKDENMGLSNVLVNFIEDLEESDPKISLKHKIFRDVP